MKKQLLLLVLLGSTSLLPASDKASKKQARALAVAAVISIPLGLWLVYKQIPRLSGTKSELPAPFNAPIYTQCLASLFLTIGAAGVLTGISVLATQAA